MLVVYYFISNLFVSHSPSGKWLLSQASKPDSTLTVWNWNMERIVLKQPNLNREIWVAKYNPFVFGGIITSGNNKNYLL